jgi:hypothetical protein
MVGNDALETKVPRLPSDSKVRSPGQEVAPSVAIPSLGLALADRVLTHLDPAIGSEEGGDLFFLNQFVEFVRRDDLFLTVSENNQHMIFLPGVTIAETATHLPDQLLHNKS